jgi:hypothetical protein
VSRQTRSPLPVRHTHSTRNFKIQIGAHHIVARTETDFWKAYDKVLQTWRYQAPDLGCQAAIDTSDAGQAAVCGLSKLDLLRVLGNKVCGQSDIKCDSGSGFGNILALGMASDFGAGRDGNIGGGSADDGAAERAPLRYENPGHHDPTGGPNPYNPNKAVLPVDAQEQFANSIEIETARWTKVGAGRNAMYYRYFQHGDNVWHFSGSTAGVTRSGKSVAIPMNQVPISIRRR